MQIKSIWNRTSVETDGSRTLKKMCYCSYTETTKVFPIIELDLKGKKGYSSCKWLSRFYLWAILYINNESNHSRDRRFVPSIVWALWLWPLIHWLLVAWNVGDPGNESHSTFHTHFEQLWIRAYTNWLGWYGKKKTIFLQGSMECPYCSFN